jgi:hypothetical protein
MVTLSLFFLKNAAAAHYTALRGLVRTPAHIFCFGA